MKTFLISVLTFFQIALNAEIYDCFTFFNELDLLKVRFEELYDSVDHFVIVESPISFTGKKKPLYFAENSEKFEKYKDKVIYIVIDHFPNLTGDQEKDHWTREQFSRNTILKGLEDCKDDDVIFISDLDEIPSASAIPKITQYLAKLEGLNEKHKSKIKDDQLICDLQMRLFMYQMNRENFMGWWGGSKAAPYRIVKKLTPWGIKLYHHTGHPHKIENAGWHFNTMGGKEKALYKWLNTGPLYSNEEALNELGRREDLLEKSFQGQIRYNTIPVPIDDGFPRYFLENIDYFRFIGWVAE